MQVVDGGAPGEALPIYDGGNPGGDWIGTIDGADEPPAPPTPPVPPQPRFLTLELVDANGITWDLGRGPVRATNAGIEGLGQPTAQWQTSEAPGVDGQRLLGWRLKARDVFLPIRFKGAASNDVTGLQRKFWDGVAVGKFVTFRVTDHEGAAREIRMRLTDDGGMKYKIQPYIMTPDAIGLTFTADDPWWFGAQQEASYQFTNQAGEDFFGGDEGAPDFHISAGSGSSGRLKLANPGDAPAAVLWTVTGATAESFSIMVGTHIIAMSQPLSGVLELDTDPRQLTARLNGQLYPFRRFDAIDFAMIPEQTEQPVLIELVGTGSIVGRLRPRYLRGF